jgi:hypothetical protein
MSAKDDFSRLQSAWSDYISHRGDRSPRLYDDHGRVDLTGVPPTIATLLREELDVFLLDKVEEIYKREADRLRQRAIAEARETLAELGWEPKPPTPDGSITPGFLYATPQTGKLQFRTDGDPAAFQIRADKEGKV